MTVSYQYDVASSTSWGFIRLLFRWRGSVWKLVYREFFVFSVAYLCLAMLYRLALTDYQKQIFEMIVYYSATVEKMIPLPFILGFYVSFTATRWWNQYTAIPWPDKLMNIIALYAQGQDDASRIVRRTLLRYVNLSLVLVLRSISMAVKRRFPTKDHLVEAGFMTKPELEMFQAVPSTEFNTFWIPCTWFINLLREARQECRITDSNGLKLIMEELNEFRSKCGLLWSYDWISIPLVYTQVVTMATYAFFLSSVVGRQYIQSSDPVINAAHRFDYYVPFFTILQFFFYMGLLKVAEQLVNPFGDDDEDFELNWMIDRHLKVSYLGVDTLNCGPPPLMKDCYFHESDIKLPYTQASLEYKKRTYRGSVANMHVPTSQQFLFVPEISESDEDNAEDAPMLGARRASTWTIAGGKVIGGSVTNLTGSQIGSGESMESVFRPPEETYPSWTAAVEAAADVAFSTSGTSGGSPRGGPANTGEEAMDRLEPSSYLRKHSNPGRASPARRADQPIQIASLKGIIRRLKQPIKQYPKQFTVRPYYAAQAEGVSLPSKGVTFGPEVPRPQQANIQQTNNQVSIPVEEDKIPHTTEPLKSKTPSLQGSTGSVEARRLSLELASTSAAVPATPKEIWMRHNSLPNVQDLNHKEHELERSVSEMMEHEAVDDLLLELPCVEDVETGAVTLLDPGIIMPPENETSEDQLQEDDVLCFVTLR